MAQKRFEHTDDRRDYFRVDDVSIVQYRVIDYDENINSDVNYMQRKKKLTLKARLESMTREMQPLHKMISAGNGKVANYLSMIDKKLDMISDCLVCNELNKIDSPAIPVNLGAGGISFDSSSPVMNGSMMEMEVVLLPEKNIIYSMAKVISCTRNDPSSADDATYKVAVEFVDMDEEVRDMISRHVITREIDNVTSEQAPEPG